jgi:hypothetical protein
MALPALLWPAGWQGHCLALHKIALIWWVTLFLQWLYVGMLVLYNQAWFLFSVPDYTQPHCTSWPMPALCTQALPLLTSLMMTRGTCWPHRWRLRATLQHGRSRAQQH